MNLVALSVYSYFLYTLFWPPAITRHSLPKSIDYFTIHGIWPERNNGTWPQYCNNSQPFNESEIADLVPILKNVWYDYNDKNLEKSVFFDNTCSLLDMMDDQFEKYSLWRHEWSKHGTCAEDVLPSERAYFLQAIKWHHQYQPLKAFEKENIYPNNTYYTLLQLQKALNNYYQYNIRIMCEGDILSSLELCFDKNLLLIDCLRSSKCPKRVYFKEFMK